MCINKLKWLPSRRYEGVFDDFRIYATRLIAEDGKTGWRTRSHPNHGGDEVRVYLVVTEQFYKIPTFKLSQNMLENAGYSFNEAEAIKDPPDAERQAILKAIAEWSTREPDNA